MHWPKWSWLLFSRNFRNREKGCKSNGFAALLFCSGKIHFFIRLSQMRFSVVRLRFSVSGDNFFITSISVWQNKRILFINHFHIFMAPWLASGFLPFWNGFFQPPRRLFLRHHSTFFLLWWFKTAASIHPGFLAKNSRRFPIILFCPHFFPAKFIWNIQFHTGNR